MIIEEYLEFTDNFLKEESKQYTKTLAYSKIIGKVKLLKEKKE
jgi:hypothetical protein